MRLPGLDPVGKQIQSPAPQKTILKMTSLKPGKKGH